MGDSAIRSTVTERTAPRALHPLRLRSATRSARCWPLRDDVLKDLCYYTLLLKTSLLPATYGADLRDAISPTTSPCKRDFKTFDVSLSFGRCAFDVSGKPARIRSL